MSTPPDVMDAVLQRHFEAEGRQDMAAILATLTEDCEHNVVGWPTGPSRGYTDLQPFYRQLFADFEQERVTPLRRLYGDDFVVDEVLWEGRAVGQPFGIPGGGRPVSFRLLHLCGFRDGRISRENVWMDFSAILRQLGT